MRKLALFSAGSNSLGQLAHGTEEDSHCFCRCIFADTVDCGPPPESTILCVALGANHTLVLLRHADGATQLWACGDARRGQLGDGYLRERSRSSVLRRVTFEEHPDREIKLVAASWETSYIAFTCRGESDILISMGSDDFGDLGIGGLHDRSEPGKCHLVSFNHLFPTKTAYKLRILDLKAGPHTTVVRLLCQDHEVHEEEMIAAWGTARHGQLGHPVQPSLKPRASVASPCALDVHTVHAFAVGNQHIVFLTSDGTVNAFGSNRKNQLTDLSAVTDVCVVGTTWNGTYLVRRSKSHTGGWSLLATGDNSKGQLARPAVPTSAPESQAIEFPVDLGGTELLSIACGSEHVLLALRRLALSETSDSRNTEVWAWGWNEHGNLGLGHTDDVSSPTLIWPNDEGHGQVVGAWAGCGTSWIAVEI